MDGTIEARATFPSPALRDEIAAVLGAAEGLLLYGAVLHDPVGEAYLTLLRGLSEAASPSAIRMSAAGFFTALARAAASGAAGPGDAWQRHLSARILSDENSFSRIAARGPCEAIPAGLRRAAQDDLMALGQILALRGERLGQMVASTTGRSAWIDLEDLGPGRGDDALIAQILTGDAQLLTALAAHYRRTGVGRFAAHRAFRWVRHLDGGSLVPIQRVDPITFDDLIGYADQRQMVRRNTEHFLRGRPANNLLLYGERGTGKSSTVKALLNAYADQGLRLVEVAKSSLGDFARIVGVLADQPEHFIIFVDDLSFDENELGYAELKAILEGGVEIRPSNVLIYATSNRRHLVLERFSDRAAPGDEVHAQDTLQEKLSLADRFGVTVIFSSPDQAQYLQIVEGLARRRGLAVAPEHLRRAALQWAAWNNGRSGRTARQFIDDLSAELGSGFAQPSDP